MKQKNNEFRFDFTEEQNTVKDNIMRNAYFSDPDSINFLNDCFQKLRGMNKRKKHLEIKRKKRKLKHEKRKKIS
mgnify:CR=1 FL=1